MRSLLFSLVFIFVISGSSLALAKAPSNGEWKEVQRITAAVQAKIAETRQQKKNPNDGIHSVLTVTTGLPYNLVAIAAYYQPKTLAETARIAELPESWVLGKALIEVNFKRDPKRQDHECLFQGCARRELFFPLTAKGLGITDAPLPPNTEGYGTIIMSNWPRSAPSRKGGAAKLRPFSNSQP